MDKTYYEEMVFGLNELIEKKMLDGKRIYLFGHCNATEELAGLLLARGFPVTAILDNNRAKQGRTYEGIIIRPPEAVLSEKPGDTLVCIAARAYAAMEDQLRRLGYSGRVRRLVDYNSYAEYSLADDTIAQKRLRVERGRALLGELEKKYPDCFRILCPFSALGDVYFVMSYLPHFLKKRGIEKCVVGVIGRACGEVVRLFGGYEVEVYGQKDMDETVQAALYMNDGKTFIPHQDRPYVINLSKALYVRQISLEQIYCCGVFGLPASTAACKPMCQQSYPNLDQIRQGRAVILSPYAKSVTALKADIWNGIIGDCLREGYQCFTNVAPGEKALPGTIPIDPAISEIQSVVERAGIFIGLRSGLCDVIRDAACRKVAFYPDYHYCDTKWKAIDMYRLEGWENVVAEEGMQWKMN